MNSYIMLAVGIVVGVLVGFVASSLTYQRTIHALRAKVRALREQLRDGGMELPEQKRTETMKKIVWACVINGFAWIWCSYILAAFDKQQIAETLSTAAVTEIIGVVLAYALKSLVENLSKHNHWPDKRPVAAPADPEPEDGGDAEG